MEFTRTILGRVPSKKNSKIMVCRGKFPILLSSKKHEEWFKDASRQILRQGPTRAFAGPVMVDIYFFAPDARKSDLTNKAESIMDLLVGNGILTDDNWYVAPVITLSFAGVDRENPRTIISIRHSMPINPPYEK